MKNHSSLLFGEKQIGEYKSHGTVPLFSSVLSGREIWIFIVVLERYKTKNIQIKKKKKYWKGAGVGGSLHLNC